MEKERADDRSSTKHLHCVKSCCVTSGSQIHNYKFLIRNLHYTGVAIAIFLIPVLNAQEMKKLRYAVTKK